MNRNIKFSIVVPLYNEAANVTPLYVRLTQVMEGLDEPYEVVFVDVGSTDHTLETLYETYESDSRVRIVALRRNFGQTAALKAGFDAACGEIIISTQANLDWCCGVSTVVGQGRCCFAEGQTGHLSQG